MCAGSRAAWARPKAFDSVAATRLLHPAGSLRLSVSRSAGSLGSAGAHKLARIIWTLIATGQPYDDAKAFDHRPSTLARRLKNLQNQAQALNMKLVPA